MSATAIATARRRPRSAFRAAGREQAALAGGQLLAGVGNLAFALICARALAPAQYSHLAAFLAAYLLLYMPFSAFAAGGAFAPAAITRRRRLAFGLGAGVALVLMLGAATGLGQLIGLDPALLLALAVAAPAAGLLALERGRALGERVQQSAIGSLLAEPAVRIGLGIPAAAAFGVPGAAAAVVIGGYGAIFAALGRRDDRRARRPAASPATSAGTLTVAFVLLAVLQNQDVLWANAQLASAQAARFAVLSTLGGMAAFASTTVPLVLLPRARRRERGALAAAVAAAALLGTAAALPALVDGGALVSAIFGARYAAVAPLAAPYLIAMALLGVSRVLAAHRCATSSGRPILWLLGACALLQAILIEAGARSAAGVAHATLAASAGLLLGLAALTLAPALAGRWRRRALSRARLAAAGGIAADLPRIPALPRVRAPRIELSGLELRGRLAALRRPSAVVITVTGLTIGGLLMRILAGRSLWLDEATSITQARMPFSTMLASLRDTDVQPPLHDAVLWLLDRLFGDSEAVMRSPSLVAGTLLIPVLYAIGRDLWDKRTGIVAATLVTVAPFVVWYSQEARMYALFMLFGSLALWAQVRILVDRDPASYRWRWWVLYSIATAALAWTQYFGLLFALVQQAAFAIAIVSARDERRTLLTPWLASAALIAVLVTPLVPFVYHQYQINQASGRGFGAPSQNGTDLEAGHRNPTVYAVLTNIVWGVWGYHSTSTMAALTSLWPLGILLALALLGRGRSWRVALLVALAGFPIAALFVVGQFKPFLFEIRYFCAGVPVAMLLLARVCSGWSGRRIAGTVALAAVVAASFMVAFDDQQFSQTNPRLYDFQGALARISREARPGDELLYAPQYLNDLVGYYAPGLRSAPLTSDPVNVAPHGHVFVMASFQQQPQNARFVRDALNQLVRADRPQMQAFRLPQVQVWEFR